MQLVGLFAALLTCGHADAATVTYTFDEAGWVNTAGTAEDFAGSFSGTVEGNGTVGLADLSGFTAIVTETNAQNETKPIANFGLSGSGSLTSFLFDITTNTLSLGRYWIPRRDNLPGRRRGPRSLQDRWGLAARIADRCARTAAGRYLPLVGEWHAGRNNDR